MHSSKRVRARDAYAGLERRAAQRTRELQALLDVSQTVAATLELAPLLGLILDQLKSVVEYSGAGIHALEGPAHSVLEYRGPLPRAWVVGHRVPPELADILNEAVRRRGPVVIQDLGQRGTPMMRALLAEGRPAPVEAANYGRALLCVPLIVNGAVTGSLNLVHPTPGYYTRHHSALAGAFANHAAIAIENARLYARAQEAAAMEERQRLARDLHDSVAQSLYGLSLSADAATRLIASGDLAAAVDSLRDVRESAQAAQKEMRMLIVDLRPPDLARDGLVAALRARVSALEERLANLITSFEADPDLDLRLGSGVEHALYRIAQEALTNVVKHATARAVAVSLRRIDNVTVLEIADDGAGFDQDQPGCQTGFGLRGMAERAAEIGARLDVRSRPGKGTTVRVHLEQ